MDRPELAPFLARSSPEELSGLVAENVDRIDVDVALELKRIYDAAESSDPDLAVGAARALEAVAGVLVEGPVAALSAWVSGMAALDRGELDVALDLLESAEQQFLSTGDAQSAAETRVSKLIVLAILGRYDEATATGIAARDQFLAAGDQLAAGKIEQNLGNIAGRRERHAESETWFRSARERYVAVDDEKQLAQIANCLGTALKWQHQFREAAEQYAEALRRAERAGLTMTIAEVEDNLGLLSFFQGQYDIALDYLERSRARFTELSLPHETAFSELELAEVYRDLGLSPEVLEMTSRALPVFEDAGMQAEAARAWLVRGRAFQASQQIDEALACLDRAAALFVAEENALGGAMVMLARAELYLLSGRVEEATDVALAAEAAYQGSGVVGRMLLARWVAGESLRRRGENDRARELLQSTLAEAEPAMQFELMHRSETSLGLLAAAEGNRDLAEELFRQAIDRIETLRAPLPVEDFRAAFLADRLQAYTEMVRLCLADGTLERLTEALEFVERARSRVLVDELSGGLERRDDTGDESEQEIRRRLAELREELNWFYSQIERLPDGESLRGSASLAELQAEARDRERMILDLQRQASQRRRGSASHIEPDVIARLQERLDAETAVVEYFSLDGELLAFIITSNGVSVVERLGSLDQVVELVRGLRFQLDTLRYGKTRMRAHMGQLTLRAQRSLQQLYDLVFAPLEGVIGSRRLVVVPHHAVHYVPFQSLFDGASYLVQRFEISYAPSTSVLLHCLQRDASGADTMLLMGVPDERIPRVRQEVEAVATLFPGAIRRDGDAATLDALREHAPAAGTIHLACHGYFRADNPLFSSLQFADGWLTVREARDLGLRCSLVTLSACETGISDVAPGDELIGIARGFMAAGAPSVMMSLWTVDDDSTAMLMEHFYRGLRTGNGPAAALRQAQLHLLESTPHPFYWAPFVVMGRW